MTAITVRRLGEGDGSILSRVDPDVFDHPVQSKLAAEFLADPRHHIVVALDADLVVGMATGVHYVHPDKPAELFINEVGVASGYRRRGIAAALVRALLEHGRGLGCHEAWVLTEPGNAAARQLYGSIDGGTPTAAVMFSYRLAPPPTPDVPTA